MTATCPDCGAEAPTHYGSCVSVDPAMKAVFADLDRDRDERRAREARLRASTRQSQTPPQLADALRAHCGRGRYVTDVSAATCVPNGMAFNVTHDDGSVLTVTINQTMEPRS